MSIRTDKLIDAYFEAHDWLTDGNGREGYDRRLNRVRRIMAELTVNEKVAIRRGCGRGCGGKRLAEYFHEIGIEPNWADANGNFSESGKGLRREAKPATSDLILQGKPHPARRSRKWFDAKSGHYVRLIDGIAVPYATPIRP
jgi:hypothetical protein